MTCSAAMIALLKLYLFDLDLVILALENELIKRKLTNPSKVLSAETEDDSIDNVWDLT